MGLKSKSHNTPDGSRYLVVFKKLPLIVLANEILNDGIRAQYYELIPPTEPLSQNLTQSTQSLPPNHTQQTGSLPQKRKNKNSTNPSNFKQFKPNPINPTHKKTTNVQQKHRKRI